MLYRVSDTISDLLFQEFASISVGQLLLTIGLAFVLSLYAVLIYRLVYAGVLFSKRFALSLVLLSLITSVVILAISSNVVLSLGMVGALSIVRFRTAVKDVMDTVFMFWAIVIGIVTGAGFVLISIIATLVIGILLLVLFRVSRRVGAADYLVVLRLQPDADAGPVLAALPPHRVKARNTTEQRQEIVLEARLNEAETARVQQLLQRAEVREVNIVSCNLQTTL